MPKPDPCPTCGQVHERCAGHKKKHRGGGPCQRWPVKGATVCRIHSGTAPHVQRKIQRERQQAEAERAVAAYGLPVEIDPHSALIEELYRTHGHVRWLSDTISEMEADELHGPVGGGKHSEPVEMPHIWVRLYQEERKHLTRVADACVKAGIEQRRITLAEQQAEMIAQFGRALLSHFGIDPQSEEARAAFRKYLEQLLHGPASEITPSDPAP